MTQLLQLQSLQFLNRRLLELERTWVPFIGETCGVVKIASGDFTFRTTVEAALESNAKVIASTSATSLEEVKTFCV